MTRGRPATQTGCDIDDCPSLHYARGYCRRHYEQAKGGNTRTGSYACPECSDRFASQSALTLHRKTHRGRTLTVVPDLTPLPNGDPPPARAPMSALDALLLTLHGHTTTWHRHGACRAVGVDPAWFFPAPGNKQAEDAARTVCAQCPVKDRCLADALNSRSDQDFGIRGGTSVRQRRELRNRMARGVG